MCGIRHGAREGENCSVAATRILIALNCYKLKHGELPDTLEELVPEYFDVVPLATAREFARN